MLNDQQRDYARFGERLSAYIIDNVIAFALSFVVYLLVDRVWLGTTTGFMDDEHPPPAANIAMLLWFLWNLTYLVGKTGHSWGRKLVGIKVVDGDGEPIGFWRALGRNLFAMFISGLCLALGYLWVLWDADRQAWHDKVFRTYVVSD
jgi:uncharacterized RDD family membrane protein YckC